MPSTTKRPKMTKNTKAQCSFRLNTSTLATGCLSHQRFYNDKICYLNSQIWQSDTMLYSVRKDEHSWECFWKLVFLLQFGSCFILLLFLLQSQLRFYS